MTSAVVLLSGGMDSATLLHFVKARLGVSQIQALTITYGQKHARETACAVHQAAAASVAAHHQLDLTFFGHLMAEASALTGKATPVPELSALKPNQLDQPPTYVPNRNMVFLALAAALAESRGIADVFYGAQTQDRYGYWDCTAEFLERLNATLELNRRQAVQVQAPFLRLSKREILKLGMELGVDYAKTWSCYRGLTSPCLVCPACVERQGAFAALKMADPLLAT